MIVCNLTAPRTRREGILDQLASQSNGGVIAGLLFSIIWLFAYPTFVRFPDAELPDFWPIFILLHSWYGVAVFAFLGIASNRFRAGLLGQMGRAPGANAYMTQYESSDDDDSSDDEEEGKPKKSDSRPASGMTTVGLVTIPDLDDSSADEKEQKEGSDKEDSDESDSDSDKSDSDKDDSDEDDSNEEDSDKSDDDKSEDKSGADSDSDEDATDKDSD